MEGTRGFGGFGVPANNLWPQFARLIEPELQEGENLQDVLAGSASLGLKRARLLERNALPMDIEFALALLCWWPFKPKPGPAAANALYTTRRRLFTGAGQSPVELLELPVPVEVLRLTLDQLYIEQQSDDWTLSWLGSAGF